MKPVQHARISAHRFGGRWQDYLALHDLIDSSKAAFPSLQHRALLHSADLGAALARSIFGPTVRNSDGAAIPVEAVIAQHVSDDLGWPCPAATWIERLPAPPRRLRPLPRALARIAEDPAAGLAQRWLSPPGTFSALVAWFDQTERYSEDPRHRLLLHNSLGIFLAERALGPVLDPDGRRLIPTREAAELLVLARIGCIPSVHDVAARVRLEPWMAGSRHSRPGAHDPSDA